MKIFEELGMMELLPGAAADVKVVAEENAKFMAWAQQLQKELGDGSLPPEAALPAIQSTNPLNGNHMLDHHPTHMVHHRRFGLTEQFRALPEALQMIFIQHIMQAHLMPLLQEIQTGIGLTGVLAGMMGAPPQQPGQGAAALGAAPGPASAGGPSGPGAPGAVPGQKSAGAVGPFGSAHGGQM